MVTVTLDGDVIVIDARRIERERVSGVKVAPSEDGLAVVISVGEEVHLGSFPLPEAAELARSIARHASRPIDVPLSVLSAVPALWDGSRVRSRGIWRFGLELSAFGPVWLEAEPRWGPGAHDVEVIGEWLYPNDPRQGFGHLGASPGCLVAQSTRLLGPPRPDAVDGLTGVLVSAAVRARLSEALAEGSVSVALLDIDGMRLLNHGHGYAVGDAILRGWAEHVGAGLEPHAIGRFGPDRLLVVLTAPLAEAHQRLSRLHRESVAAPQAFTWSAGLTEGARGEPTDAVIARLDEALHSAKRGGRDRIVASRR